MSTDKKVVSLKVEDGMLLINVDANKDGEAVIQIKVNILEVPDEVLSLLKKDKDK